MQNSLKSYRGQRVTLFIITLLISVAPVYAQIIDDPDHIHTIRCLTPIILEYESNPESRAELGPILGVASFTEWQKKKEIEAQISNALEYKSESGRFLIQYEITGTNAVPTGDANNNGIPDYVEWTAAYADSSWNHLVQNLGFKDPVPNLENPLKIKFQKFSYYGTYSHSSRTITVHNNFTESPFPIRNNDPEGWQKGSLKVTVAHEFKHAIQFATLNNVGSNWIEMDATMAEEVVFPNVDDYLNYLTSGRVTGNTQSISLNPSISAPNAYYHATFGLYYRERFGDQFWVDVWNRVDTLNPTTLFPMMEEELMARGEDPDDVFITMYLWHLASGPNRSVQNYGFNDRHLYPEIVFTNPLSNRRAPFNSVWRSFSQRSANYFEFFPSVDGSPEDYLLGLFRQYGSSKRMSWGLIAWMKDGSIITDIIKNDTDDFRGTGQTSTRSAFTFGFLGNRIQWDTANIERMAVALVNPSNSAQMAQMVLGSDELPSTKRIGQITTSSTIVPRTEAEALLDILVQQANATPITGPVELLNADVSGNGRATAYDASMILQKGNGQLSSYPADPNNEIFVPSLSWYPAANAPQAKVFNSDEISQVQGLRFESVFGNPEDPFSLDDTLRVHIISGTPTQFRSAFFEIQFDSSKIFYEDFSVRFNQNTNFTTSRNFYKVDRLRLAFASDQQTVLADTLATLHFTPKIDATISVSLTLLYLELDESTSQSYNLSTSADIRTSDGVGIERPTQLPISNALDPAYPNPFNPTTNIPFSVSELSTVRIEIFDILGRQVSILSESRYSPGRYTVPFNATSLSSGTYIIRMTVTPESQSGIVSRFVRRVTLLK